MAEPYDPIGAVDAMMRWLEERGWDALSHGPVPPVDPAVMEAARDRAADAAIVSGRADALREVRRSILEWALAQYRRAGLQAMYFSGALAPAEQRTAVVDMLIDAATAYLLQDILPADVSETLFAPFDVWIGGPMFRIEPEET